MFSEWALADPRAWDYIRPILAENGGWALFIYTARGRNHGASLYELASRTDGWFAEKLTVEDTGVLSPDVIEAERRSGMAAEMIRQEYYCSFEAALVDKPGVGKVVVGRGAVNQKGPESALLAALHAIRGAGAKVPVNIVLVAEGEEEIGSPHFKQVVSQPEVAAALRKCRGVFMPSAAQDADGGVTVSLGAKGVRVNAVAPGPINTELVRALSPEWQRAKAAQLPLGRFGEPEDVAETVAFLASPAARLYVGQTLGPNSGDVML